MPRSRKTWWQRLVRTTTRTAPPVKQHRRRPHLEVLEDRAVPSTNPIANHDIINTDGTNPVTLTVLDNDLAPKGIDKRSVVIKNAPAGGKVNVNAKTGEITYVAKASTSGTDTFTYKFKDKKGNWSNKATVSIVVNRPTANDDFADTDGTNPVVVDVLENDTDPDGPINVGSVTIVTQPQHGGVSVNPTTGEVTYTGGPRFSGTDSFTYFVVDEAGARSNLARVTIIVHQPKANDDFATTATGQPVTIDVLGNDTDPDGSLVASSVQIVKPPSHGAAVVNPSTGAIDYTPASGFVGTDTLKYVVADEHGALSDPATVTIVVTGGGMNDDVMDTDGTAPVHIAVTDNDFIAGGLNLGTLRVIGAARHGKVSVDRNTGVLTYQALPGFGGTDTFRYAIDGRLMLPTGPTIHEGTVTIIVNYPTANDDFADTDGTNPVTIDVLGNDTDPDGALNAGSVTVVGRPAKGFVLVDSTTGAITYTPKPGVRGTDTFTYFMADEAGARSNIATVTVIVNQPTANDDFAVTNQGTTADIAILDNDTDPDGALDPASIVLAAGPQHGTVSFDSGIANYTPTTGFFGTDTFFYKVSDVHGAQSNTARVTIIVLAT